MFRCKKYIYNFTEFFCKKSGLFSGFSPFVIKHRFLPLIFTFLMTSLGFTQSVVTIDADGGADYRSLDTVLSAIKAGTLDPDTVKFIGNDQDTYTWSTYCDKSIWWIVFKGTQSDPDKFPIINHTKEPLYNFFNPN
ncbi:MAG: hypothetical protein GX640_15150, partial [Fibrobacter sp.]|nr:hypothetical protein [Fibrobacter sp.]